MSDSQEPVGRPTQQRMVDSRSSNHDTQRTCGNCGSHVSSDFVRVFADNDGELHACPACANGSQLRNGAAWDPDYDLDRRANYQLATGSPFGAGSDTMDGTGGDR